MKSSDLIRAVIARTYMKSSDLIRAVIARTYMKSSDLIRAAPPIPIPTVGAVYDGTISTAPTFGALFS